MVFAQTSDAQQRIRDELAQLVEPHRREDGIDVAVQHATRASDRVRLVIAVSFAAEA